MTSLYDRWLNDLWNGDLDTLDDVAAGLVAEDFTGHWPGRPALVRGPAALAEVIRQGRLPFEGLTFTAEVGPLAEGNLIAARWSARGAYAGGAHALPGVTAAPGTAVEFHGHDLLRIEDGRPVEYWVISEAEQLMAQLTGA
ncbi:ester cyclase [Streptomyces marincola]|uniref:ester cyclase n=1 Tax=Streptomyces marincola TaxID=2878388 RepID=UPI001CF114F4|nr:nuclear transport factor 2 family protein [Streptomyces marincola]UCM90547.1 ester cyclase [Streptomyces marincola]